MKIEAESQEFYDFLLQFSQLKPQHKALPSVDIECGLILLNYRLICEIFTHKCLQFSPIRLLLAPVELEKAAHRCHCQ